MDRRTLHWTAIALACLLLAACKEKHDPLKPTVAQLTTQLVIISAVSAS